VHRCLCFWFQEKRVGVYAVQPNRLGARGIILAAGTAKNKMPRKIGMNPKGTNHLEPR
jgi:hypothetical protein